MSDELRNLKRRVERARRFPANTCPASRHLHGMALQLARGWTLQDDPSHAAESMLAVLEALWKTRAELARLKGATGAGGE